MPFSGRPQYHLPTQSQRQFDLGMTLTFTWPWSDFQIATLAFYNVWPWPNNLDTQTWLGYGQDVAYYHSKKRDLYQLLETL